MHAVCSEPEIFKRPCIYCQISDPSEEDDYQGIIYGDSNMEYGGEEEWEEEEEEEKEQCTEQCEEGEDNGIFELLFSPENAGDSMFCY